MSAPGVLPLLAPAPPHLGHAAGGAHRRHARPCASAATALGTSNLVLLEHVNFKVPYPWGKPAIEDFFVRRLGAPECPASRLHVAETPLNEGLPPGTQKQMHVNMGLSQIHFEWCTGSGRPYSAAQRLRGCVTIAVDDVRALRRRLEGYARVLPSGGAEGDAAVVAADPFDNVWVCVQGDAVAAARASGEVRSGGVGHVLAILAVDLDVETGISAGIADAYADLFNADAFPTQMGHVVRTRFGQEVRFNETRTAPSADAYDVDHAHAIHVCYYVDPFDEVAAKACCRGLFWSNPDYVGPPINDNVRDLRAAHDALQFRMKHLGPHYVLEHEIRGARHRLAPKRLLARL